MHNLSHGFDNYKVNDKTLRKIAQIFVAFSEKLNFKRGGFLELQKCKSPLDNFHMVLTLDKCL